MAKYSLEIKIKAVKDVLQSGMSAGVVAKGLSTAHVVVQRWVALYKEFACLMEKLLVITYLKDRLSIKQAI